MPVQEFKASLDKVGTTVTIGVILLMVFSAGLITWTASQDNDPSHTTIAMVTVPLMALTIVVSYLLAPKKYLITDKQLIIIRAFGGVSFNLSDIQAVEQWNDMGPGVTLRTFGVGGLFGYYGYYYNSTRGKMRFFATKLKSKLLITLKDNKKIVISPDDEMMLVELQKYSKQSVVRSR